MATVLQKNIGKEIDCCNQNACFPWSMSEEQGPEVRCRHDGALTFLVFNPGLKTAAAYKNLNSVASFSHYYKGTPTLVMFSVLFLVFLKSVKDFSNTLC